MTSPRRILCSALVALALVPPAVAHAAKPFGESSVPYATSMGAVGVTERISDIMRRQALEDARGRRPERDAEEKENGRIGPNRIGLPVHPGSPDAVAFGDLLQGRTPNSVSQVMSPQPVGLNFTGATLSGTNPTSSYPPDDMGTVGPTQYVVFVNGRLVTFSKTTGVADGVLNANPDNFFSSVRNGSYTSDPRIRYDRLTGRWFLIIINVSIPNRILIAVSDAANNGTITGTTAWTFFYIPIDTTPPTISSGCLADYPTLGLDANALYIGTNDFCSNGNSYNGTDGYVIRKTSIMGAGPIVVTAFRQLCSSSGAGPYTPQGVDNYDPNATEGYFIGEDNASYGVLQMRRVSNPGGTPTISANIPITVATWLSPLNTPHLGNTRGTTGYLNCVDDRLFAAHIRNGQLWTAHNVGTTNAGAGTGTASRDGVRWYQLNVPAGSGTPTVVQSGLVYMPSGTNSTDQRNFIIPSIMVNGQGHAAVTVTTAGTNEYANAAVFGRLASDAAGAMQATTMLTSSSTAYNPTGDPGQSGVGRRWGDYTYVSLDPLDDMTMWSVSQFCNASNSYGVRVAQLLAPPPATPSALADVPAGQSAVTLTLTGTSSAGSGFYDPGADLAAPAQPFHHLAAAVTANGVSGTPPAVVSATYLTPTTVQLVLNAAAATANAGSDRYTVTITNPDGQTAAGAVVHVVGSSPTATIAAGPSQAEGNSGTSSFAFTVNLSSAAPAPVVVRYHTADGTATVADGDYVAANDSVTIATGQSSGTIHVTVNGDTKHEPDETFTVTLTSASNATLGSTVTATGTIQNDDPLPTIGIVASAGVPEGNSGTTPLVFGVTLSNPSASDVSAGYATADNSATTADGDYQAASGTVTIPAGQTSGNVTVQVVGDTKYENNESFTVALSGPSGATLGNALATGTITNDDAMPAFTIDDVTHLEGDGGTTLYRFTVSLSAASGLPAAVDWATADSTATVANDDYQAASGSLAFPAGTTSQTLDVLGNGDTTQEPDELFKVVLSNPTSATLARPDGLGTIQNDDATPIVSVANASVLEGNTGTTPLDFTVTLTNPSALPVSVHYATSDGTATVADADYVAASGVLEIPALATTAHLPVSVVGDACGEPDETFTLTLSSPTNATIAVPTATGTILNDDPRALPTVTVGFPNGGEVLQTGVAFYATWSAADSVGVPTVDLFLSHDGGATWPDTLGRDVPNTGTHLVTIPGPATPNALLKVVARDAACNVASDVSDAPFTIMDYLVGVDGSGPVTTFALGAVRPNPTRGSMQFGYQLPREASVRISVLDVQGREIAVLASGPLAMGRYTGSWSGLTPGGTAARGLYFIRFAADGHVFTRRFALIR